MDKAKMERIASLQNRIQDVFRGSTGYSGERVLFLAQAEKAHFEKMFSQSPGYAILMDAFFDLTYQTLQEANLHNPSPEPFHSALFLATFWRFRSSYNIFWQGYYYDAASHLRAIFENIFNFGALLNGYITKQQLFEGPQEDLSLKTDQQKARLIYKHFENISRTVKSNMIGRDSGLSEDDQKRLSIVIGTNLHSHVHRAESNQFSIYLRLVKEQEPVSILPEINANQANHFMVMSIFAGWAVTRLLPFLSQPNLFSQQWLERYKTLDDAFAIFVSDYAPESGRAFERFIHSKLKFGN